MTHDTLNLIYETTNILNSFYANKDVQKYFRAGTFIHHQSNVYALLEDLYEHLFKNNISKLYGVVVVVFLSAFKESGLLVS